MTRLVISKNKPPAKSRSALYMDIPLHQKIEKMAAEKGVSFNIMCIALMEHTLESEAEADRQEAQA